MSGVQIPPPLPNNIMKSKAAILVKQKKDLLIAELDIPKLIFGQVLVKIISSRICGSQIGEIEGVKGKDKFLPHLLGHEAVGIVMETGPAVKKVSRDDIVILSWIRGSGINAEPAKYKLGKKIINAGYVTTFSEMSIVSENRVTKIDRTVPKDLAVLCADVLPTGFNIFSKMLNFNIGDNVLIIGAAGMGLGAVLGAHLSGANKICVLDRFDFKLKNALKYGANELFIINEGIKINENITNFRSNIDTYYDHVIDYSGNNKVIEFALNFIKSKANLLIQGVMPINQKLSFNTLKLNYGLQVIGSSGSNTDPDIDFYKIINTIKVRKISLRNFFSHQDSLENINKLIREHKAGKVINAKLNINTK